jgi:hypothetical protein
MRRAGVPLKQPEAAPMNPMDHAPIGRANEVEPTTLDRSPLGDLVLRAVTENVLLVAAAVLESSPELAARLRRAIGLITPPDVQGTAAAPRHVSTEGFAKFMGVSVRTIAKDRKRMTPGVHFHHHGRRVLYHLPEAEDFLRQGRVVGTEKDLERLAADEVTRLRARVVRTKMGEKR